MMHLHDRYRLNLDEARLVRFASSNAAPNLPQTPNTPPVVDTRINVANAKETIATSQQRIADVTMKLEGLKRKRDAVAQLHGQVQAGQAVDKAMLDAHGIADRNGNGVADETKGKLDALDADMKTHVDDIGTARAAIESGFATVEQNGPGGKLDASFMRAEMVMKDPNAGFGEKLVAVIMAFQELQNLFKGITSPAGAPDGQDGNSPESGASSPQGKKESVRTMMKDAGKNTLIELKTDKETNLTALKDQKGALEGTVTASKTALGNEQLALTNAKSDLETNQDDVAKQNAVRQAEGRVTVAEGAVRAAEQQLASLNADIAKVEADVKTIKDVEEDSAKALDDFNHGRQELAANLFMMLDGNKVVPSGKNWDLLNGVRGVLADTVATSAPNGLDVKLTIPNTQEFLKPFVDADVDAKDLQVNSDGSLKNPDAFLATVEKLITKVRSDTDKAKSAPAAPAAGGAGV